MFTDQERCASAPTSYAPSPSASPWQPGGLPAYVALSNGACADPSVDVYAMAMAILFMRTGRDPIPRREAGRGRAGRLGWGAAGRAVARAWAEAAAERPGAEAVMQALEAEAGRRAECRLS